MNFNNTTKYKKLAYGIIFDIIGMLPIPFFDLIWAPASAYIMTKMFKGESGKVGAFFTFVEEILPLDIIPTFTVMWLYTFVFKAKPKYDKNSIIDVDDFN